MLDCSDAAINRWHTLNISWDCTTVAFTTLCQDCKKKTKALVLMNRKAMRVSPTHPGSRTRLCPLTLSAHNGSGGHPATETAVWRFSERFSITEPDWLRPFGIFLAHWFLMGEQLEVLLPLVGLFLPEGGRGGDSGGGTWTVHLDSVSTGNASHLAHTPSPLLPPPQPLLPPLQWGSSSCWQQWQEQHREKTGGGRCCCAWALGAAEWPTEFDAHLGPFYDLKATHELTDVIKQQSGSLCCHFAWNDDERFCDTRG